MTQEEYEKLQNNTYSKIFKEIITGVNFITPIILDYKQCGNHIIEISKNRENPDIDVMYGVTVITKKDNKYVKNNNLCKAFYNYKEVEQYLKKLKNE